MVAGTFQGCGSRCVGLLSYLPVDQEAGEMNDAVLLSYVDSGIPNLGLVAWCHLHSSQSVFPQINLLWKNPESHLQMWFTNVIDILGWACVLVFHVGC